MIGGLIAFARGLGAKVWIGLGVAAAVLIALAKARSDGRRAERAEGMERQLENVGVANAVDQDIGRLPDGGAADRLRNDWSRD